MPLLPKLLLLIDSALYLSCCCVTATACNGRNTRLSVDYQPQTILSPGYPENYETNDKCTWTLSLPRDNVNFALQLVTQEIDVDDVSGDCNSDYLEAYEGIGTSGRLLAKWCDKDRRIVKSTAQDVTLKFHSDQRFTGKGFVLQYSLVRYASAECMEGQRNVLQVGSNPVYESFQGKASVERCEWQIRSEDPNKQLVLEMFKASNVPCDDGSFDFYEGRDTDSHVSFEYCSNKKPFTSMYLRSSDAVLIFRNKKLSRNEPDNVILKISARSTTYECTVSDMPTLEITEGPIIFSLPFAANNRGTPCPVQVAARDGTRYLRLDVMGTDAGEADCSTDVITVKGAVSEQEVMKSCNRGKNPVYRHQSESGAVITANTQSVVFIRATAVHWKCSGFLMNETAYDDIVINSIVPTDEGYTDLSYCKMLITAENPEDIVSLFVSWTLPVMERSKYSSTDETTCMGDYINVYDGNDESAPVLMSTCRQEDRKETFIESTVYSSGRSLLVVMDADARIEGQAFKLKYHSIAGGEHCEGKTEISVSREPQIITSPNYPDKLPMGQKCLYHLMAEEPEDEIVVRVIEANFRPQCQSILLVYDTLWPENTGEVVGRVCGKDTPTFVVAGGKATLLSIPDDVSSRGGWKVEVSTRVEGSGAGTLHLQAGLISLSLSLVFALFLLLV